MKVNLRIIDNKGYLRSFGENLNVFQAAQNFVFPSESRLVQFFYTFVPS